MKISSIALCATALCLAFPGVAAAATGAIEGKVVDSVSKSPVANIEVCAYSAKSFDIGGCALTDAGGDYTLDEVQAGIYIVEFWAVSSLNYLRQFYDGTASWEEADPIFLAGGATVAGVDAELQHGAELNGTVRDAQTHAPIEGAEVCAYADAIEFGRCTSSDSNGTYTLTTLQSGLYGVEFSYWEGSADYIAQYYDHKPRWDEANLLSLTAGESRSAIDADLQRGAHITGTITDASGTPVRWAVVCAQTLFEAFVDCEEADSTGRYELGRLAPGAYKVVFEPESRSEGRYRQRYYSEKSTFSLADQVVLGEGTTAVDVNARLESANAVAVSVAPASSRAMPRRRAHRCRRGYRRKLVRGKRRCARIIKHKRHRGKKSR